MRLSRRQFVGGAGIVGAATLLAACNNQGDAAADGNTGSQTSQPASSLALDAAKWRYDADDDVYYQLGVSYCEKPANEDYQKLAVLVPGAYFQAADNGDGTYTCKRDESKKVGDYTAATAPVVMPINTPGYSAQSPMAEYKSQADYTGAGFVYVHAGCRGRDAGAPAGVTDLKAAVRFLRHVAQDLPGNMDRIFTFGMSGGGAQSALMGATGDAAEYTPYLTAIGAVSNTSDAVYGSMDWCPITGLDVGDAAYEWMMGPTRADLSEDEQAISNGLAEAYAAWVNGAGIVDANGAQLRLEESGDGVYQAGSYYEAVRETIEESLNNFLEDTEFPYEVQSMGGPGGRGQRPEGAPNADDMEKLEVPEDGVLPEDALPSEDADAATEGSGTPGISMRSKGPTDGMTTASATSGSASGASASSYLKVASATAAPAAATARTAVETAQATDPTAAVVIQAQDTSEQPSAEAADDISRTETSGGVSLSGTYETAADYIAALNANGEWVTYDESANTATITTVADFCQALKLASKSLGAFDQLDRGQGENTLFGTEGSPLHFDEILTNVLETLGDSHAAEYKGDLAKKDAQGVSVADRVAMYTPLHYLLASQAGFGKSVPAKHWRIRSGIAQGDTALTTELNLALALKANTGVESVDFATVWGQGHTEAERTGSATENFIAWVRECAK